MQRHLFLLLSFFLTTFAMAQAQTRSVSGKITDKDRNPLELLTVALEGTVLGTNTNTDGYFEITEIDPGIYTLRVGGVGYGSLQQQVDITNSNATLSLSLSERQNALQEVIVSGSRNLETLDETPASVYVIDSRTLQLQSQVSPNIANVLANTVPGLGFSSNTTSNVGQTMRGRTIDPTVIERVEIVKGATAVYGNGADGGLINYITKQANTSKPFSAFTSVTGTGMLLHSDETFGGRISQQFSGKVKAFDYVASGTYEKTGVFKDGEGQVISPVYGLGETKMYNGFAKIGYTLSANHRVEAMYNYFGSRQNSDYIIQEGKYAETPSIGVKGETLGIDEGTRYNHNAQLRYTGKNLFLKTALDLSAENWPLVALTSSAPPSWVQT